MVRTLRRFLTVAAAVSLLASALPLVARYWWAFDLFTHFRVQLIGVQVLLVALLTVLGGRGWSALVAVCLLVNAWSVRQYLIPHGRDNAATPTITIMSVNVRARNTQSAGLLESIEQTSPDIVLIVEYNERWGRALASLWPAYPFRFELPRNDNFGIALYSKRALTDVNELAVGDAAGIDARVNADGATLRLIGVHLRPPVSRLLAVERQRQLEDIEQLVAGTDGPLVVVGDLNLSPYSPRFSDFVSVTHLRDALAGRGPGITWPSFLPLFGIPIDHCLVSRELEVTDYRRLPEFGSDHYPILVGLRPFANAH